MDVTIAYYDLAVTAKMFIFTQITCFVVLDTAAAGRAMSTLLLSQLNFSDDKNEGS
jgi:hypothetical protein